MGRILRWLLDARRARGGGVAVLTAMALPPALILALGAIELQQVVSDKATTQDAADHASLWGAQQLTVTSVGAEDRAEAYALSQIPDIASRSTVTVTAQKTGATTMNVSIDTVRMSFFMNLLPPGGFKTHAESTAVGEGITPLCVLSLGEYSDVVLQNSSRINAPLCLVHSNRDIGVNSSASLTGQLVEAVRTASGPITPSASTGAQVIDDPFDNLNINFPFCIPYGEVDIYSNTTLQPGIHPKAYNVRNGATLTLAPGDHYFCNEIVLKNYAKLVGDDVALLFGPVATFDWKDGSDVRLHGRKTGAFAGFVMIAARQRTIPFTLESDPISDITGTIYVPNTTLVVEGDGQGAQESSWTVVATKALVLTGSPNLVINANYSGSDVPVPNGVGSKGSTRITQ